MNWQRSIRNKLLELEIKETELKIELLQVKLQRLHLEKEYHDEDSEKEDSIEDRQPSKTNTTKGTSTKTKDRDGNYIYTGDRVEVLTPSKTSRFFQKGDEAEVEGTTYQGRILISAVNKRTETTNRTGNNLRVKKEES